MPDVLTPSEVADLFSVSPTTVSRWADEGRIKGFKTVGGHWRFHSEDITPMTTLVTKAKPEGEAQ